MVPVPTENWIVTDEDGQVLGRLKSPYYSAAVHFANKWWGINSLPVVWPWDEATRHQQAQASYLQPMDTQKHGYLLDWAERLQAKFERTGRVQ